MKSKFITIPAIMEAENVSQSTAWRILQLSRDCLNKKKIGTKWQPVSIEQYCKLWDIDKTVFNE